MIKKILIANASVAHLYSAENLKTKDLALIKDFLHPDSRKKVTDLVSGTPTSRTRNSSANSSYEDKHGPKELEADVFAVELAKAIDAEFKGAAEDKYLIVAPTHLIAMIMKHTKAKSGSIEHLAKDYTKLGIRELSDVMREHVY